MEREEEEEGRAGIRKEKGVEKKRRTTVRVSRGGDVRFHHRNG